MQGRLRVTRRRLVRELVAAGYGAREVAALADLSHTEVQRMTTDVAVTQPAE